MAEREEYILIYFSGCWYRMIAKPPFDEDVFNLITV